MNNSKKVFIRTYGCQMNVYDSELVSGILKKNDYSIVHDEGSADIVLVTGCTIREHADQRALGYIRQVLARKKTNSELIVGLLGCLGQRAGPEWQEMLPELDLILGPDAYRNIHFLLQNLPKKSFVEPDNILEDYDDIPPLRKKGASAFIAISRGCDHNCTYCIVPFTRGRERSRPLNSIVKEVGNLVEEGFKEVTLLGQNVNSYSNNGDSFPDLLEKISEIRGIKRIRYTTSHPKDLSERLVGIIRDKENVCSHVHLPVQSGSDRVLKI
ncbi:MiaB/RimO family radical SAM methylthiotransferase, partial [candidate division KSB1 bacterium]|nr:MiaB/RimO family radical SAM methylthiotransferase [candidate division KSB1 bacterium]